MYDAKEAGRDRFAVFAPESRPPAEDGAAADLGGADPRTRSPRTASSSTPSRSSRSARAVDAPTRHELLLRMVDDDGDLIPPATFLYVAERFGLVEEIDRWVVREARSRMRRGRGARRPATTVFAVNLSAKSIQDPRDDRAHRAPSWPRTGVDPRGLIFEVTETARSRTSTAPSSSRASSATSAAASRSTTSARASRPSTT